ncbi:hypothetical protein ACFLQZ_02850 [Acidobacteriota bacterium]
MNDGILHKHFEARHIETLLDIDKNRLYHWVKLRGLITPDIEEGSGRAGRSKFSFKNLLEISLIKDLYKLRFELPEIYSIMKSVQKMAPLYDPETGAHELDSREENIIGTDIWESFSSNRPDFEKDGYILVISKGEYEDNIFSINEKDFYKMMSEKSSGNTIYGSIKKPFVVIDLLERIRGLEQKTGHRLDYYEKHMDALREGRELMGIHIKKKK